MRRELAESRKPKPAGEGLPVGASAPAFELPGTDAERSTLAGLLKAGQPVLLVFLHPQCAPCRTVAADLGQWREHHLDSLTVVPVSGGDLDTNIAWARETGLGRLLVQDGTEVLTRYHLRGTPTAVLIDTQGRIASPPAAGPKAVGKLLTDSTPALIST